MKTADELIQQAIERDPNAVRGNNWSSSTPVNNPFVTPPSGNGKHHTSKVSTSPSSDPLQDFISRLDNVEEIKNGSYIADCPLCGDNGKRPNLKIDRGDKVPFVVSCFGSSGHKYEEIVKAIGYTESGTINTTKTGKVKPAGLPPEDKWVVVATYDYTDASNNLLYQVRRLEPPGFEGLGFKTFRPYIKNALGGWKSALPQNKDERVLYHLPELYRSHPDEWVIIVEGEKSCDRVRKEGLIATTSQGGAKNTGEWKSGVYPAQLEGRRIAVIADNDQAGLGWAQDVKESILAHNKFADLRVILELPGLAKGQDVYDWLQLGCTRNELLTIIENALSEHSIGSWFDQSFTMGDCYDDIEPTEYLVDNLLPLPSLTIGYGFPGSLKSMLFLDLACCVATGKPWLQDQWNNSLQLNQDTWELTDDKPDSYTPAQPFNCQQAPVLWVDVDNSKKRTKMRARAIGKTYGVASDGAFYALSFPVPGIDLADNSPDESNNFQTSLMRIIELIERTKARLVVLDNLIMISGGADENSSQIGKVMSALRHIAERTNTAVIVIHHPRKSGSDGGRAGNALRGHSAIEGAIDLALSIHREDTSDEIQVIPTKSRDLVVDPFGAVWRYKSTPGTKDLDLACFFGTGPTEKPAQTKAREDWECIKQAIADEPDGINQTDIVKNVRKVKSISRNRILSILKWRVENGFVETKKGNRKNETLYTVLPEIGTDDETDDTSGILDLAAQALAGLKEEREAYFNS